jgi:hypothetical protein
MVMFLTRYHNREAVVPGGVSLPKSIGAGLEASVNRAHPVAELLVVRSTPEANHHSEESE